MPGRSLARRRVRALALLLLLVIAVPGVGVAAPGPSDLIGGRSVAAEPELAANAPEVSAPAGVLVTSDGRRLWERDADAERDMASTTKIMTALVALERADLEDTATVSADAVAVGGSSAGLKAGQRVPVRTLLEAMLVCSANEAAVTLAEHVAGSVPAFVDLMNAKADSLGLRHTSFTNPHGIDEPGHHASAGDLSTLARVALDDPVFAETVAAESVTVPRPGGGSERYENTNQLIGAYSGATGVKTGWTDAAGYCLVASAERDGIGLVAVVLDAQSEKERLKDARALFNWGYEHYAPVELVSAETTAALVTVSDYLDVTVPAVVAEPASAVLFDLDGPVVLEADVSSTAQAPIEAGQVLGTVSCLQNGRVIAQVPAVAAHSVPEPDPLDAVGIWFTRLWRRVFGGQIEAAPVSVM